MLEVVRDLIVRIAVASVVSAVFCATAVYFVVDISLRGIENSQNQTARRIDDVNTNILALRSEISEGFREVQTRHGTALEEFRVALTHEQNSMNDLEESLKVLQETSDSSASLLLGAVNFIGLYYTDFPESEPSVKVEAAKMDLDRQIVSFCSNPEREPFIGCR